MQGGAWLISRRGIIQSQAPKVAHEAKVNIDLTRYRVKLAETEAERLGAQRLRYRVFIEEMGADASPDQLMARREWDAFDPFADHLILLDQCADLEDPLDRVAGVYRLMRRAAARRGLGFYGASEFDLSPIEAVDRESVELGRSCVALDHRGGAAMHLLWNGLAQYVLDREIELLFGAASFPGSDPAPVAEALSYLHHNHLAPPDLRVRARPGARLEMDMMPAAAIEPGRALRSVPPLIKAYLRLGGVVGDGAWIDHAFKTIDVCVLMDTGAMKAKHRRFYERNRSATP
jgi:L-ornithine Nalpha-acyltransferase